MVISVCETDLVFALILPGVYTRSGFKSELMVCLDFLQLYVKSRTQDLRFQKQQ